MSTHTVTTVTSQTNPLAYMKAIATLVGSIVTGLLGVYAADTPVGQVLTVVAIVATAFATWAVPNALVVPALTDEGEVVGYDAEGDDSPGDVTYANVDDEPAPYDPGAPQHGYAYEESGGQPFPVDADEGALYGKSGTLRGDDTPYEGDRPDSGLNDPHRY